MPLAKAETQEEFIARLQKLKLINQDLGDKKKNLDKDGFIVPENCGTCKFSKTIQEKLSCCKNSPTAHYEFPYITKETWCGDYKYDEVLR